MKRWLVALGLVVGGMWFWKKVRGGGDLNFTVVLENLPFGATTWTAYWWDGSRLVLNKMGPNRPVTEAAGFFNVSAVPGSYVLAEVMINASPLQLPAFLPNPVNFASYAFNWGTMTLRLI